MKGNRGRIRFSWFVACVFLARVVCCAGQAPDDSGRRRQSRRDYDALPPTFSALDSYGRIALEPYREQYDRMPYHEKARVYSQMFEFMNNRAPNFSPAVLESIKQSEELGAARSSAQMRELLYKGAPPPRKPETPPDQHAEMLSKIPVPWKNGEEGDSEEVAAPPEEDNRMESLRYGRWNLRRGAEERKTP